MEPASVRDSGDVLTLGHIGDMYRRFGEVQGIVDEDHYRILTDALSRVKKRSEPLYGRLSSVYDMAKSVRTKKMTRGQLRTVLDRHLETFVTEVCNRFWDHSGSGCRCCCSSGTAVGAWRSTII
ncbi:unnamed protein product [Ectocarpus sp. 8 AP-2014]